MHQLVEEEKSVNYWVREGLFGILERCFCLSMGIPSNLFLNLVGKFRSWIGWEGNLSNIHEEFWMSEGSCKMCYECDVRFTAFNRRHRCRSCGRMFCGKCMQSANSVSDGGRGINGDKGRIEFCKFCFQAVGRDTAGEYGEKLDFLISREKPMLPLFNSSHEKLNSIKPIRSDMLPHFLEVQQGSPHTATSSSRTSSADMFSAVSFCRSGSRSDEEDAEDFGKNFFSPTEEYGLDVSDVDASSINTGHESYSFKSVAFSPLDSPSMMTSCPNRADHPLQHDQEGSPRSQDVLLEPESIGVQRRHELETTDYCTDSLSIFQNQCQEVQGPLDFENNALLWFPPPPEGDGNDAENNFFDYDDEDDNIGDSGMVFSSSSFCNETFPFKEKPNDGQKEPLRAVIHGHFRALVSQLLKGENIQVGNENSGESWLEIVASLAWQAANFVKPDTSRGGSMDPGDYVKVKCMVSGRPCESTLIKGVVCTKNIKHKRMTSQYRNPRLLILGGALEYQRVPYKLTSIDTSLQQEIDHLKMTVAKIEAHRPNVLLVEKSVSSYAQEYLLAKDISLVLNVKRPLLELIARCTGAHIVPSIDNLASTRLGHCEAFRLERVSEECGKRCCKKFTKTLMFFEGCPRRLGCTVLLRGTCREELKKIKRVVQYAVFAAHHLSLEISFLADEGATLPKIPVRSPDASLESLMNGDSTILEMSISSTSAPYQEIVGNSQRLNSFNVIGRAGLHSTDTLTQNEGILGDPELDKWESCEHFNPGFMESCSGRACSSISTSDEVLYEVPSLCSGPQYKYLRDPSGLPSDIRTNAKLALLERLVQEEEGTLENHRQPTAARQQTKPYKVDWDEVSSEYFSTADNHQSILVSMSSHCVLKGSLCERSQLFRIKFYGSFDKPLGRFLQDDLFDQRSCCRSCNEPAEAHVRCYTHQQGSLTISVRRLPSFNLTGERDGKIWMWHRCLKCAHKDGVPPATQRVVMSDAAWGLSFGKFLELSFSNNATANRVASCGHSLQRDCLRYYGFGSTVAFFRYSPIDILSVHLPPSMLEFNGQIHPEWFRRETTEVANKIEIFHAEVFDVLRSIEKEVTSCGYENSDTSDFYNQITELKNLLKNERTEYDGFLKPENWQSVQLAPDILELNRLRRRLLIDSHKWYRRLSVMDSFLKSSSLSKSDHKELNFEHLEPNTEDLSIKSSEDNASREDLELTSGHYHEQDEGHSCEVSVEKASLESFQLPASNLSDKIDLAWTSGSGHSATVHVSLSYVQEAGSIGPVNLKDNVRYREAIAPKRVFSFDSSLRFQDKTTHRRLSSASLHMSSAKSFHASGDLGSLFRDPIPNIPKSYFETSPRAAQKLNLICGYAPLIISSPSRMANEGVRLLLPQTGQNNIVIAVYDNEPTSIISYALNSKEYEKCLAEKVDGHECWNENCNNTEDELGNLLGHRASVSTLSAWQAISSLDSNDIRFRSHGSDILFSDPKRSPHVAVSFADEGKVKFSVNCYFAKQFDALRRKCCPSEMDFICSLSRCRRWRAQGGKSNADFAKTLDDRFIIKQVPKTELDSFEECGPQYFKYLTDSLNSGSPTCLAKVLGIYQVTVKPLKGGKETKTDFMVMENLFFKRSISRVYDLKGSVRSRYNPDTTGSDKVLLDLNLLETLRTDPIFLGSKAKRSLERAVWNDTSFLASVAVMDYSLLVGVDEERKELVMGIIDFMRQYTWDKHLETWVKASGILGGPKNASPTVISPKQYKKRFRKAMSTYFLTVPDQWSS
ncbi:putative 1-phosphatidylinositol-3-phosphate 5-kinase FAB1C [Tasmannia lanceolata]|uniref:putative 1-phosphatidylinositol-3-phosphate 5-kinase FAB1C n=1 Tax=Tasmannia lanceolata TaxID=3420 RepID=UPI004064064D